MLSMFRKCSYLRDFNSGTLTLRKVEYKGKLEDAEALKKLGIAANSYRKRTVNSLDLEWELLKANEAVDYFPPNKITLETIDTYILPLNATKIDYFNVFNPTRIELFSKISNGVTKELTKYQSEFIKQFSTIVPNHAGVCDRVYAIFKNGADTDLRVINLSPCTYSYFTAEPCAFNIRTLKVYSAILSDFDSVLMLADRVSIILAKTNPDL